MKASGPKEERVSALPTGYESRAWRMEDAADVAAMMNAYGREVWGRDVVVPESLRRRCTCRG